MVHTPVLGDRTPMRLRSGHGPGDRSASCVLIVEQEQQLGTAIKKTLEQAGYEVVGPAVTVSQALAYLEQTRPDAAVLDLHLSSRLSVPVARALVHCDVPFLLLTNHPCPGMLHAAYDQARRLERPMRRNELVRSVQRVIRRATTRRATAEKISEDRGDLGCILA